MSFQTYLDNLREKPDHVKKRYAFWSSLGLTALLAMFWLGTFAGVGRTTQASIASAVNRAATPAASLSASAVSAFNDVKDLIFGPQKVTYSSLQILPGDTNTSGGLKATIKR
ncbi:MAG: hypothetical protein KGI59_03340 [Patescibacteria group bacterium]|nr:hypothetical protein [Patescibacteria group bacterium]MDE2172752.1 hypothetical protein [Patescibacteria group bacterium]